MSIVTIASIRSRLAACYEAGEAAALSRIVCCDLLGQSSADYYLGKDIALSSKNEQELDDILTRLCNFEPLQYIEGRARFLGRDFCVTPAVLIPRPETEELVERMLREVPAGARVLDVGTGSGCIAVTLAKDLPRAQVTAWDVSAPALEVARSNARRLEADVRFEQRDVLTCEPDGADRYDVIVSNPPYIVPSEMADMEPQVLDHEPHTALFVPENDPLLFYRAIAITARQLLHPGGKLYLEINPLFATATADRLRAEGFGHVTIIRDLSNRERFVTATR